MAFSLLSICSYYTNKIDKSLEYVNRALEISPNEERLLKNRDIIENALKNQL